MDAIPSKAGPLRAVPEHAAALPQRVQRPVVLVGLMGSGKTTIGQRLAARLRLPFADSDEEIVRAANLSISELFERHGEAAFREGERRLIARLIESRPKVIATGGGAFMDGGTRTLILQRCHAVWLDADVDVLAERTGWRPGKRPLLHGHDPRGILSELAAVRNPIYALAHLHVRSQVGPHGAVVAKIIEGLRTLSVL